MIVVDKTHARTKELGTVKKSIFLAGPSPRGDFTDWHGTWREEAVAWLEAQNYDGHVFIPLPFSDMTYSEGVAWEQHFLEIADVILFWIPRSADLPGFTTNVEFGEWMKSGKVVLGYPADAERMRYLAAKASDYKVPLADTLEGTLQAALTMLGDGAERSGGEVYVPLHIWKAPAFQSWYKAQVGAGNRLVRGRVLWEFIIRGGNGNGFRFCWTYHAEIYVAAEDRIKSNEFVFTRSDISTVVAYTRGTDLLSTKVLTIKEFRVPARTPDGFVHELPGGSSFKPGEDVRVVASHELEEETGLKIDPARFIPVGARQLAATLSSHISHIFAVEITQEEADSVVGKQAGEKGTTEITYVGQATFREILTGAVPFDFSMIGMVAACSLLNQQSPSVSLPVESEELRSPTLTARDRIRTILHANMSWEPSDEELKELKDLFASTEDVPPGTVLSSTATAYENRVFLGGTCNNSTWRDQLIPKLDVPFFNPVVDDWTPECQAEELRQREVCSKLLYVITPLMKGVYSIAELVDDVNNSPERVVFCWMASAPEGRVTFHPDQQKSLKAVADLVKRRGGRVCSDLDEVAAVLNGRG